MANPKPNIKAYYEYIHINGETIRKPQFVVDSGGGPEVYFDSPFVMSWKLVVEPHEE